MAWKQPRSLKTLNHTMFGPVCSVGQDEVVKKFRIRHDLHFLVRKDQLTAQTPMRQHAVAGFPGIFPGLTIPLQNGQTALFWGRPCGDSATNSSWLMTMRKN
jgi:hypothetical protein